jgi:hypothetical protein
MKITKTDLLALIYTDYDGDVWTELETKQVDTWRWGTIEQITLRHNGTQHLYGYTFKVQHGDHHYNSIEEEDDEIELYPMVAQTVTTYRRADGR